MSTQLVATVFCALALRVHAQTVTTLAGGGSTGVASGSINGVGTGALFSQPYGIAVDSSGAVYAADYLNNKVRLIQPNRTVITLAGGGTSGVASGSTNGVGTAALFDFPLGVAIDTSGAVYVTDYNSHKIRVIFSNLTVVTLAGGSATGVASGSTDGVGSAALFNNPVGIAVDSLNVVYVADFKNHRIRLIFPNRTVITLAGGSTMGTFLGSADGVGSAALFNEPRGIATDPLTGIVYVADSSNNKVRLIYPNLTVITLAGGGATGVASGSINGVGTAALFDQPYGVAVDSSGAVYVADYLNNKVRLIHPNRTVITRAGGSTSGVASGSTNGAGSAALFHRPIGIAVDVWGAVYVADTFNNKIRFINNFLCSPGTSANTTLRQCVVCLPGSFSNFSSAPSCSRCAGGTFAEPYGSTACDSCPAGHACPPGTSSWARLNCGRGSFCPEGSAEPIPCPIQMAPVPYASWAAHPMKAQGPAFLVETASCRNHCFWNFTSGAGVLSKCCKCRRSSLTKARGRKNACLNFFVYPTAAGCVQA